MIIYLSIILTTIIIAVLLDCFINKVNDDQDYSLTKVISTVVILVSLLYGAVYGVLKLIWWLVLRG